MLLGTAGAQTVWIGPSGGDYLDTANWSAGILPTINVTNGVINSDGIVNLAGSTPNVEVLMINGTLNVNSGGSLLTANGSDHITVGDGSGESGLLNINGGEVNTLGASVDFFIGLNGATGTVNVNSGGTLNTVKALEVIDGTLTFSSSANDTPNCKDELVIDNNGVLAFQTSGLTSAKIIGNSLAVELGSTSKLDMQLGGSYSVGDSWTIITGASGFSGVAGGDGSGVFGTVYDSTDASNVFSVDYGTAVAGEVTVTLTAIPEPATLGMVALCGGGILFIRKRMMI